MPKNCDLQTAVCNDETMDLQQVETLTTEILSAEGLSCNISAYESGASLLDAIQGGAQF